tara:strand:- start:12342 stop:16349 length:4008 start_codon:yes stop_codon:yes gene_type:complete
MNDVTLKAVGIKVDPTQAKRGLKETRDSLSATEQASRKVKQAMRNLFVGFSAAAAIREFAAFDQQMTNVAVVAGAADDELSKLSETAKSLALGTRFDPAQVAQGMYSLASAGQSVNEIIGTLPNVLDLAEAAQADLGQTTELTVSSMAQFGIEADDAQRVVDVFTASIASSSTNVQRLQVAMANSGSTAAAMNQDFESSVAVVSLLTTAFGSGEKAGTGYKSLLSSLAQNGEDLGITIADSAGKMRPLVDILDDIQEAGIPSTELIKTFGTEAGPALSVLLGEGTEAINEMREGLLSTGQASETAARQLDTLQGDWDQLISTVKVLVIELGEFFEPALRGILQFTTGALNAISGLFDDVGRLIGEHNQKLDSMVTYSDSATQAIMTLQAEIDNGFDTNDIDEFNKSVATLETELDGVIAKLREFKETRADALAAGSKDDAVFAGVEVLKNLVTGNGFATDEQAALERQQESISNTLTLAKASQFLTDTFGPLYEAAKEQTEANEKLAAATDQAKVGTIKFTDETKKLLKVMGDKNGLLKAEIAVLKGSANAINEFNKAQAVALGQTQAEKDAIAALIDEQQALAAEKQALIDLQDREIELQQIFNQLVYDTAGVLMPLIDIEQKRLDQREALQMMYDRELITFDQYVAGQREITRQFNQEADAIQNMNGELEKSDSLMGQFFKSFRDGMKQSLESIKQAFADNPLEATAQFSSILPGILESIEGNDSSARALNEIAAQIPIPAVQAVAQIIDSIDQLFGGKLLGTNYQTVGSGFNVDFGAGGVSGNQFERQERERSFFRGTRRRIRESDLSADFQSELDGILNQAEALAEGAARALGVEYIGTINASLEQEVDKNGNLIRSVINAFGREIEGGVDDLQRYLFGGSIFDQIAQVGPEVAAAVFQIQEAYIGNSERFLEAAQATLLAQTDINNGFNILVNGSLSDIITLTEDYSRAGESLVDTYARVTTSFKILEEAVGIMGLSIDMTRQQAIEFAVGMSDAAGGTDQLLRLTQGYFSSFYSEQELYIQQLQGVNDEVNRLNAELGTDLNFENFREQYEAAFPELTPAEVVQWLRLGNYLAEANQLAGQLANSSLNDAISEYMGMADALNEANYTLGDQLNNSADSIRNMIAAYDGSIDAENRIAEALRSRYEMELAFIDQIRSASESITQLIAGAREDVFLTGLNDEEQYNYFRGEAESAAAQALLSDSPEEIQRLTERAIDYERRAFGLLDDGQQDELRDGFLSFIDELGTGTTARLAELEQAAADQSQELLDSLGTMLNANAEAARQSNEQFATSVETFAAATVRLDQAVARLQQIQVVVDVRREDAWETQGRF